ncbi:hypothetical protein GCM10027051_04730 [Niabella terrae]
MEIKLELDEKGSGAFNLYESGEKLGELVVDIKEGLITAHHTEVQPAAEGRGYGRQLLEAMARHARGQNLKIKPLCPYVLLQFKRHPEQYADLWQRSD